MARLRKFVAYRRIERPYTRVSKYRAKSYIRTKPHVAVIRFNMGNGSKKFQYALSLVSKSDLQIRDNALESARQTSNRVLESALGASGYFMRVKTYPFHILRENPLASGAGADRFSTDMQKSFGKPIGRAARVKKGNTIIEVGVDKANFELGLKALRRAAQKIPCSTMVQIVENK